MLPRRFTQPILGQHHHDLHYPHRVSPVRSTSRPFTTSATISEPVALATNPCTTRGDVCTLRSPPNNGRQPSSVAPMRRGNNLSRKRPRTTPCFSTWHNNDTTTENPSPDSGIGSPASAAAFPVGDGKKDATAKGDGCSLWGATGVPPTGVIDPRRSRTPLETEWACPSSSEATSTPSLHDDFSEVFATPVPGALRRAPLQKHPARFRVTPARLSRSPEGLTRPRLGPPKYGVGSLGNWPLNTAERWMRANVTRDNSQGRLAKLREIRLTRLAERERKRAAWAQVVDSSSDGGDPFVSDQESEASGGREEGGEKTEQEKEERRKLKKAMRKKERRTKRWEAECKSRSNRGRWRTAGRHGGIVARAKATVPALATRGDLVKLKGHADRVLIIKISRCWTTVADFFGVKLTQDINEVPPPPGDDEKNLCGDASEFWKLLTGSKVQLTPMEISVVQARLKGDQGIEEQGLGGQSGDGGLIASDDVLTADVVEARGDKETGSVVSTVNNSSRITYGQIHGALFHREDLEAITATFRRDGEMREEDERRIALKRQQFEESMAKRRSGAIEEVVKAYSAGLGYRPLTRTKTKRTALQDEPIIDGGGSRGGNNDGGGGADDGDNASETTIGTVATSPSGTSSSSSRSRPATDWWTDGGVSNRWAMGPTVREILFLSLQAGAVAHLSLKHRRAVEVPWVKGATHIHLHRPKDALIACAKYGRGFHQLTAAQVVLVLRAYAAQRIQAQWRGWRLRRLFAPKIIALRRLVERERAIRVARCRTAFGGWKAVHQKRMELMRGARRAFYRWKVESERLARVSKMFCGTFWPLYVWRRWTNHRIGSRDKAKFLRKVYLTAVLARHLRAWNKVTDTGQRVAARADRASRIRLKAKANRLLSWWAARSREQKMLKRQWINGGMWLRLRIKTRQVATAFTILRYWAFARAACVRRSNAHFRSYYLLGEMDRRHAMSEKRGYHQRHGRRKTKLAKKRIGHQPGTHQSRHTTHGGPNSLQPAVDGAEEDIDSYDHHGTDRVASLTAQDGIAEGETTARDERGDSPKNHRHEGMVGESSRVDHDPTEAQSGGSGKNPRRSHHVDTSAPGRRNRSGACTKPPIAVLGRPNRVAFPGLEDTPFGEDVAKRGATFACEVLRDHFELKEVLKARVNFFLYQRLAPQVLARLRINANERQRSRYAGYISARRVQKKHLEAWHFAAVQIVARRGITGEALGLPIGSMHASVSTSSQEGSEGNSSRTTRDPHPPGLPVVGGTVDRICGTGAVSEQPMGKSTDFASAGLQDDVNQLEEDRKMRRRQVERTATRLSRLVGRTASLKKQSAKDKEDTTAWVSARKNRERAMAKFLKREGVAARSADEKTKMFIAGFKQHAAQNLVDVVARIFSAVEDSGRSLFLRKTFRQWRSWYMLRVSVQLYNRQRLRIWLRICVRFRYLWRGMPSFHKLRVKWSVFHRLLELMDHRVLYGTPDLPAILRRRRELLLDYSRLLQKRGFVSGRYAPEVLLPATLDPLALLQRWKEYTQARAATRFLRDSLRRRHLHRLARVTFDGWRTGLGPRQRREGVTMRASITDVSVSAAVAQLDAAAIDVGPPYSVSFTATADRTAHFEDGKEAEEEKDVCEEDGDFGGVVTEGAEAGDPGKARLAGRGSMRQQRRQNVSFIEARLEADLKILRRTVIAGWRRALTRTIRLRQARQEFRLKKWARRQPTFKKFLAFHTWQATERVRTEARLLVDAFLNRGKLRFRDQEPPDIVGRTNERGSGPGLIFFRDKPVPGSHMVCEVRVMTRIGEGVVGIQLVMTGGKRTSELPVHGAAVGDNRSTRAHSFAVDTPVERLSRFECEHNDGLIERLRVVTSGGRFSSWFGDRLTQMPKSAVLPDWRVHSLAAMTAAAALAASKAASAAAAASLAEVSSAEKAAAAVDAAEAQRTAALAPEWDIQKEYITGLVGVTTQERLVGLGVITRHVTNSHVFSYLWEAPDEDKEAMQDNKSECNGEEGLSISGTTRSIASLASVGLTGAGYGSIGGLGSSMTTFSQPTPPAPIQVAAAVTSATGSLSGTETGGGDAPCSMPNNSAAPPGGSSLSKAEEKQQRFAQEMRDREKKKEERLRLAKEKEEKMERLLSGGNSKKGDEAEDGEGEPPSPLSAGIIAGGGRGKRDRIPPAPHEEFSSMLRMRRTDARLALERSVALARKARTYTGNSGNNTDDANGALGTLTVVVGLTNWLHSALLPQLVPLPMLVTTTTDRFERGEKMLAMARATKNRGNRLKNAADSMKEVRRKRDRGGVMSPVQRAQEIRDREKLVEWEAQSAMLLEKAHRQREKGERLLDDARDRLPKVSQSVKTLRMYLEYLKLARRQIELEREFGLGALRTRKPMQSGNGRQPIANGCGVEESLFDATIKSLQHKRQDDDLRYKKTVLAARTEAKGGEGGARGVSVVDLDMPTMVLLDEGSSVEPGHSTQGTLVTSINPWA